MLDYLGLCHHASLSSYRGLCFLMLLCVCASISVKVTTGHADSLALEVFLHFAFFLLSFYPFHHYLLYMFIIIFGHLSDSLRVKSFKTYFYSCWC